MIFSTNYRELLVELTKREIKQRYKQSLLGYAWVILNPLAQMLVLAFVFSRVMPVAELGVPYPIFLYVGLLPWTLFNTSLIASTRALISNGKLLSTVYLPRETFVQSIILAKLVDFFLASTVLLLFIYFYNVPFSIYGLWALLILAVQLIFTYGLGLLVATLNLFYRDIQYLLSFMLLVWLYITPVIYPTTIFDTQIQWVFQLNPMAIFIRLYRQVLLSGTNPDWTLFGLSLIISVSVYAFGMVVFKKLEGRFADVI